MERIDGEAPADIPPYVFGGWLMDATPAQRDELVRNSVAVLAQVHRIDPDQRRPVVRHDGAVGRRSAMTAQLDAQRAYYEWAREDVTYPLIERTFAWLEAHRPDDRPDGPRTGATAASATCSTATSRRSRCSTGRWPPSGHARSTSRGWCSSTASSRTSPRSSRCPASPGSWRPATCAPRTRTSPGYRPTDLHWYEVYGALRFAIVSVRTSTRGIAYGQMEAPPDPDDLIMFRTLLEGMIG